MPIQNLQALQIHSHEPIYWHIWYLWIWSNCFSWPKLSNRMEASNGHIHIWPLKSIKTLRKCIISFFIEVINTKLTYIFREVLENPEKSGLLPGFNKQFEFFLIRTEVSKPRCSNTNRATLHLLLASTRVHSPNSRV